MIPMLVRNEIIASTMDSTNPFPDWAITDALNASKRDTTASGTST